MPRKNRLIDRLLGLPWWMSLGIAAVVFLCATRLVPALVPAVADQLSVMGWMFSAPFLLAAIASGMQQWLRSRLLDQQRGLEAIRALTWPEFEALIGEAFRRQGYSVAEHGGAAPDGGFDLLLERAGARTLVRCKHWQAQQIGMELVRELHRVMTAEGASEGILVTCGEYTGEARRFAVGKPMRLVNGEAVLEMVRNSGQR
jgi:restriction system protein